MPHELRLELEGFRWPCSAAAIRRSLRFRPARHYAVNRTPMKAAAMLTEPTSTSHARAYRSAMCSPDA